MADPIAFKTHTGADFQVKLEPGVSRNNALGSNAARLIGTGSLTIGDTELSGMELRSIGSGLPINDAKLNAKLDKLGGKEKILSVVDDLLAGAQRAKLSLDGKVMRNILVPGEALKSNDTELKAVVTLAGEPKPQATSLPGGKPMGTVGFQKFLTPFYQPVPAGPDPLPGVPKGARPVVPTVGAGAPPGWAHTVTNGPAEAGGSWAEQGYQFERAASFSATLGLASVGGNIKLNAAAVLKELDPKKTKPTLPDPGDKVTHATYESNVAGHTPDKVFASAVKDLAATFKQAGVTIEPSPPFDLADPSGPNPRKFRFFVITGIPPAASPVEMTVDRNKRTIDAQTLDGHPLRGDNHWRFVDDGKGGTTIVQTANFQMSSKPTELIDKHLMPGAQEATWQQFHRSIAAWSDLDDPKRRIP